MRRGVTQQYRVNRRQLLQSTAVAVAGVGFYSSLQAVESTSPNEKIRFACIGIGGKGASDSADANAAGDVVAIVDIDEAQLYGKPKKNKEGKEIETIEELKAKDHPKFPKAQRFTDFRVMYDKVGKDIDAVTVSTPDHTHAPAAAMGMRMGKHCFCQKPLTHDIYEARVLAELAREKKLATQMGNQGTAGDTLRKAVAMIETGVLGDIKEVHVWTNRPIWAQGGPRPEEAPVPKGVHWDLFLGSAPERPYSNGYHPFAWRGWWDFGTGALGDMACHTFNMPYWAVGLADPTSVVATSSGHNRDSYPKWSEIEFEFPATEKRGAVKVMWYDGGKRPPKDIYDGGDNSGCIIVGSKGKFHGRGDYCDKGIIFTGVDEPKVEFEKSPGHFKEFAEAIRGGKPAKSNFENYAGKLTETILLGNLAVYAANEKEVPGKKIEWDAKSMTAKNAPEVQHIVKREYRKGYTL